jgi:hypothetical protein
MRVTPQSLHRSLDPVFYGPINVFDDKTASHKGWLASMVKRLLLENSQIQGALDGFGLRARAQDSLGALDFSRV